MSAAVSAAIRTRFAAEWASRTPVSWPNKSFDPSKVGGDPNGAAASPYPWVRLTILPATAGVVSSGGAGGRRFRESGLIVVQVFVPENTGDGVAEVLASAACDVFRAVEADGVRYAGPFGEAPRTRTIGNAGGYYQINAECPFTADSLH